MIKQFLKKIGTKLKGLKRKTKVLIWIYISVVIVNVLAWLGPIIDDKTGLGNWCDFYADKVMWIWSATYGRITGLFPFSVGEFMIVTGLVLVALLAVAIICFAVLKLIKRLKQVCVIASKFIYFCVYVVACVSVVMTLNCFIIYHVTPMDINTLVEDRQYKSSELEILRNYVVAKCNEYAEKFKRDEENNIIYEDDIDDIAKASLRNVSDIFSRTSGYYPDVKKIYFSSFLSQMHMSGYYFPFSMEANVNALMYIANYPYVMCHELAHLHGYIFEDEANFVAYIACVNSEDDFFKYCGYLGVLGYVDNAYYDSVSLETYMSQPNISDKVYHDDVFLNYGEWEKIEENAMIPTEIVDEVSDNFTEVSLNLNGVEDGMASYGRVVGLMLKYYDGKLY